MAQQEQFAFGILFQQARQLIFEVYPALLRFGTFVKCEDQWLISYYTHPGSEQNEASWYLEKSEKLLL